MINEAVGSSLQPLISVALLGDCRIRILRSYYFGVRSDTALMGNTASSCTVSSKAIYNVNVEVYGERDPEGSLAKQRILLLPGQTAKIKVKRRAYLRISGMCLPHSASSFPD